MGAPQTGRFISIGSRLTTTTFAMLVVVQGLSYVVVSRFEREKLTASKEQAAHMAGDLFVRSAATPVLFDDDTGVRDTVARLAQDAEVLGVEVFRVPRPGQIGARMAAELTRTGGQGVTPRLSDQVLIERRPDRLILHETIRDPDGKAIALAAVQFSLARENRAFVELSRRLLLGAAFVCALLGLLILAVTRRWITGPLEWLLDAVRKVEAGDRIEIAAAHANDEVGRLGAAFVRMAEAVERREQDVVRRNSDMKLILDNVAQGLLTVTRTGVLLPEHSAILETWFGPWPHGETVFRLLRERAPKASEWLAMLWENVTADIFPLDVALGQLPEQIEAGDRTYGLAFRPLLSGEQVHILIVVSDITLEVERERAKIGQQEIVSMFQWMIRDRAGLLEFFDDTERLVRAVTDGQIVDLTTLKREIHTIKGNSGIFGLVSLVAVCQTIEGHFEDGAEGMSPIDRNELLLVWQRTNERRRQLLGDGERGGIEIDPAEHQALLNAIVRGAPRTELEAQVRGFTQEPAQHRLTRLGEQARSLALRLGKGDITVSVEANRLRLPPTALGTFWATFAHLLRNAVDHGLETPAERQRAGKSPAGHIQLRTQLRGDRFLVEIEDDGRGINWGKLRERAQQAGLPCEAREDLVEALFADGVTTQDGVTETSGRGVGMSAVRSACDQTGGRIRVDSEPGGGTRFQFTWPISRVFGAS